MLSRNLGDKSRCAPLPYEFQCWSATTQCWQPRVWWCLPCSTSKGTGGFLFQRRKRRALPPTSLVLPRWSWQPHAWHSLVWNQSWFSEQHQGCVTSTSLQCCCTQFLQDLIHLLWVSFTTTVLYRGHGKSVTVVLLTRECLVFSLTQQNKLTAKWIDDFVQVASFQTLWQS